MVNGTFVLSWFRFTYDWKQLSPDWLNIPHRVIGILSAGLTADSHGPTLSLLYWPLEAFFSSALVGPPITTVSTTPHYWLLNLARGWVGWKIQVTRHWIVLVFIPQFVIHHLFEWLRHWDLALHTAQCVAHCTLHSIFNTAQCTLY